MAAEAWQLLRMTEHSRLLFCLLIRKLPAMQALKEQQQLHQVRWLINLAAFSARSLAFEFLLRHWVQPCAQSPYRTVGKSCWPMGLRIRRLWRKHSEQRKLEPRSRPSSARHREGWGFVGSSTVQLSRVLQAR